MDVRCTYCESRIPGGLAKCPYCGAPAPPPQSVARSGRPTVAAFLLAALCVLGVFQSALLMAQPTSAYQSGIGFGVGDAMLSGRVLNATGAGVPNVTVKALGPGNPNGTTGADGSYRITDLASGYYEIEARNHSSSATVRVFLTGDLTVDVTLPANGSAAPRDHETAARLYAMTRACGGIFLLFSLLALAGAVACHRRRNWGLALAGAILGTFAALPLTLLVGLFAILVVAISRKDFRR